MLRGENCFLFANDAPDTLLDPMKTPIYLYSRQFMMLLLVLSSIHCSCAVWAQTYSLQPTNSPLRQQVDVTIDVVGSVKMKSARFGVVDQHVKVEGKQSYEQWLSFQRATELCRAIRYYSLVDSKVSIGEGQVSPQLRKNRKLIVDQYQRQQHRIYSPQGKLTRDELDLIDVQLSPTIFYQLLPKGPVERGDQWEIQTADLSALLALDAVAQTDVQATLTRVENQQAHIECTGSVGGGVNGVLTQIDLKLTAQYELQTHSFTRVKLIMSERREIGHAKPGLDVQATIEVVTSQTESFATLTDSIISKCNRGVKSSDEMLEFVPLANGIELELNRDWHVMLDQPELLVMRQVMRGDLIAQCSLSRLQPLSDQRRMNVELLKQQIQKSLGDQLAEFTETRQQMLHGKYPLTYVSAIGVVGEVTFQWAYHHVTDSSGNQYVFVFTIPNDKVTQFEQQDRTIVESFTFRAEKSGKQPVPASAATSTTKR